MTVKIDSVEPNIFPHVDDLDARDAGRNVEVFLDVIIEGKHTPVTVKLSYEQASDLAILLEPFRKPSLDHAAARHSDGWWSPSGGCQLHPLDQRRIIGIRLRAVDALRHWPALQEVVRNWLEHSPPPPFAN
jgi:hypothetical protein